MRDDDINKMTDDFNSFINQLFSQPTSINYLFSCIVMKKYALEFGVIFRTLFKIDKSQMDKGIRKICNDTLKQIEEVENITVPDIFYKMKIYKSFRSIGDMFIFEVPEVKKECDCNFVAIVYTKDLQIRYFTSEYYMTDNMFGFCEFYNEGRRAYGNVITDLNSFIHAIDDICK